MQILFVEIFLSKIYFRYYIKKIGIRLETFAQGQHRLNKKYLIISKKILELLRGLASQRYVQTLYFAHAYI